jgi:predicted P-loop ATPase
MISGCYIVNRDEAQRITKVAFNYLKEYTERKIREKMRYAYENQEEMKEK